MCVATWHLNLLLETDRGSPGSSFMLHVLLLNSCLLSVTCRCPQRADPLLFRSADFVHEAEDEASNGAVIFLNGLLTPGDEVSFKVREDESGQLAAIEVLNAHKHLIHLQEGHKLEQIMHCVGPAGQFISDYSRSWWLQESLVHGKGIVHCPTSS